MMATEGVNNALVAWPVALLVAAALAAMIGAVSLRTRGVYFIMITLAFAQMVYYIFISLRKYGGEDGLNLAGVSRIPGIDLASDRTFYYVVLVILAGSLSLLNRLIDSRFGQALQGIRENESRMVALGYPVFGIKWLAFMIAGVLGGLAGVLLANHNLFVSPAMMHWTESASLIIMVIVGGIGHRWGGAVGAAVMLSLEEILRLYTDYWHLPLGLLLLAIVLLAPAGLAGAWIRNPVFANRPEAGP
jgi:branched-chain amino acid transport system permease protein